MKKFSFIIVVFFILASTVHAATPTKAASPSGTLTPTSTSVPNQIDDLKERLATRVAQLRQSQKKALAGTVKAITISTITIETKTSDVKIELVDSLKVFQTIKDKRTALTTENIEKGDSVVVFGDYDTSLDLMKAKVIIIQNPQPDRIHGVITAIDKKEFTITVETPEKQSYVVDIEKITTIRNFTATDGIVKGGFTKVETGSAVHVTGTNVPKADHRISALRILDLGNLTGMTPTATPTVVATETASPSATPKSTPVKK